MSVLSRFLLGRRQAPPIHDFDAIHRRFSAYTMIPPSLFRENLNLATQVKAVEGCIVECGVWKGGMIAAMASILGPARTYHLFDSFEGLPAAQEIDGPGAIAWQNDRTSEHYHDNCCAPMEAAVEAMEQSSAPAYELHKGWFEDTLPEFKSSEPIALLRLDADWYDSTMICLEHLYDQVAPDGLIVLDDYYTWDGCSRALHAFLARRNATERIESTGGVRHLRKRAPQSQADPK